ncbi:MAG TPA: cytochrome d ubiquinol oxidase subunit II [Burkholderiales bacterium]|nr:cytochrome d ubiquinol oxidase subunit II [Burkholderiales bacterium]
MALDLVPIWTVILAIAVIMYVLLDGFDLGVGMLFMLAAGESERDLMMNSVAPVWDGNETWLVMGGIGLYAAFPLAFGILMPALYFPILFMLLGLIFRGVAFEFRPTSGDNKRRWDWAFCIGSLVATFAQGCVLGNFVLGFDVQNGRFVGNSLDWLHPFVLAVGLGLIFGYVLLGATWLVMKTEGDLQAWARRASRYALWGVLAFIGMVSIVTPLIDTSIAARWFDWPNTLWLAPIPILTLLCAWSVWRSLNSRREAWPFFGSMGLFLLCYLGLGISLFPYIVPRHLTLAEAASAPQAQAFLLIGTLFLLPIILTYTGWSYWVFRGKVKAHIGYH